MQLLTLVAIVLKDKPDTQTRAFYDRTSAWLAQWTATNNYGPVLIDEDQSVAWRIWREKFLSHFRSAMCDLAEPSDGLVNHFTFKYHITEVNLNQEGTKLGQCSVDVCDIDDGETEITEFGLLCNAYVAKLKILLGWKYAMDLVARSPGSLFVEVADEDEDDGTNEYITIRTSDGKLGTLYKAFNQAIENIIGEEATEVHKNTQEVKVSLDALNYLGVPLPEKLALK